MSINENFNQEPMTENDKIVAVTTCYNQFADMKITSKKTGIPYHHVRKYVRYERLPQVLKDLKNTGEISLNTAIATANLFGFDTSKLNGIAEEEIKKCALYNQKQTLRQIKHIQKVRDAYPDKKLSDIIEDAKNNKEERHDIRVEVVSKTFSRVKKYREDRYLKSISLAAEELIEEGLDHNSL